MQSCFILSQNEKSANIEYIIIVINDTLEQSFCGLLYIRPPFREQVSMFSSFSLV